MDRGTVQRVTLAFGIVYLIVGVAGFIPGIAPPADEPGERVLLGLFEVNALHNVAHLVLGALLVIGGLVGDYVYTINRVLAVVFLLLFVGGFVPAFANLLAINAADTILHLVSVLLTGYLGFIAPRQVAAARPRA
jgi:hypothetical protein